MAESSLKKYKQEYSKFQEKHKLPSFEFLNENFEIESLAGAETELFLKKIRKQILEKVSSGLRALEMFLNPQNAPVFIFSIIKSFNKTDKEIIDRLYQQFAEFEILAFGLENTYDEKKEAEFIIKAADSWKEISKDFDRLYDTMRLNYKTDSKEKGKSYLG
jgi:hypothetical protein